MTNAATPAVWLALAVNLRSATTKDDISGREREGGWEQRGSREENKAGSKQGAGQAEQRLARDSLGFPDFQSPASAAGFHPTLKTMKTMKREGERGLYRVYRVFRAG